MVRSECDRTAAVCRSHCKTEGKHASLPRPINWRRGPFPAEDWRNPSATPRMITGTYFGGGADVRVRFLENQRAFGLDRHVVDRLSRNSIGVAIRRRVPSATPEETCRHVLRSSHKLSPCAGSVDRRVAAGKAIAHGRPKSKGVRR